MDQDKLWARIISHWYFLGVPQFNLPRYPLEGRGSVNWNTLQKGVNLIKDGLF